MIRFGASEQIKKQIDVILIATFTRAV